MVAEPTLFLSADNLIQVRAHTTRKGLGVYCVRDFIRMTARKQLSPTDAMTYWMSAASSRALRTEHDIQDQYGVQFQGAYEPRSVCLTAAGLLMLFHYMITKWDLVLEEYKEEVQGRLMALVEGKGAEYVWDHDDGEVDEMLAAMEAAKAKGEGLEAPPENWPFFFEEEKADPEVAEELKECIDAVAEITIEAEKEELGVAKVARDRKNAFSLKGLMEQMDIKIDRAFMPAMGKAVSAKFKELCPGGETFSKKKTTYFYDDDRECLEILIQEEYMKHVARQVNEDFEEGN